MGWILLSSVAGLIMAMAPISAVQGSEPVEQAHAPRAGAASRHLSPDDTVARMLEHPAFADFGSLILPWDNRATDEAMALRRMETLLPYHSNVRPAVAISALNAMIDQVSSGLQVFYPLYGEAAIADDPTLAKAGLFFFRGDPDAPFAIVSPGGGFAYVGSLHEGFPYAQAISAQGLNAFVLRYRPGLGGRAATEDLAAAISYVFEHAAELKVSTDDYSLWGSSAGARMAASIGSHGVTAFGGADLPGPAAVIMAYTAHTDFAAREPATFVVSGERDGIAPPAIMQQRVDALRRQGTVVEYQEFVGLGHGFGLGNGTRADGWVNDAIAFWRARLAD